MINLPRKCKLTSIENVKTSKLYSGNGSILNVPFACGIGIICFQLERIGQIVEVKKIPPTQTRQNLAITGAPCKLVCNMHDYNKKTPG